MGIASRREAESWITEGRVSVNGQVVSEQGRKITPGQDQISIDGKVVSDEKPPLVYWMLHKPDKYLTARKDERKETIYDLPSMQKAPFLVSPVGRLDYRSEGLLIMTNDGELSNRLCHPKYKVPRHYHVLASKRLTKDQETEISNGIKLKDGPVKGVKIKHAHGQKLGASTGSWYFITVFEGRNRLIRRIFEKLEIKVIRLIRSGFGEIEMPDSLKPGEYRQLSSEQILVLKRSADLL